MFTSEEGVCPLLVIDMLLSELGHADRAEPSAQWLSEPLGSLVYLLMYSSLAEPN